MSLQDKRDEEQFRSELPFVDRRSPSTMTWIYVHRVGLLTTIVFLLVGAIVFLSCHIVITPSRLLYNIPIELVSDESTPILEEIQERYKEEYVISERVDNMISDDNSSFEESLYGLGGDSEYFLDASVTDDRHSSGDNLYDEAFRVQQEMRINREAYERDLAKIMESVENSNKKIRNNSSQSKVEPSHNKTKGVRSVVKGNVTVRYDLKNRNDIYLHIPAYQCEGGGEVSVAIEVSREGRVLSADVYRFTHNVDDCVKDMAVKAAKASLFNSKYSSPKKQNGTITYIFIPQ